jgi:glutamyl-tRNA reductase
MTQYLVAGVRHQSAPLEIREKVALLAHEIASASSLLLTLPAIRECVILTTCNRTELYLAVSDTEQALQSVQAFFQQFKGVDWQKYRRAFFTLLAEDAAIHLFRVASGLDSLILGESQILGQVKDALGNATKAHSSGPLLDKLFKTAISVGKRIRTETGISQRDISVSWAAYAFAQKVLPDALHQPIAVIGGGKMAEILLSALARDIPQERRDQVVLVNRSEERLRELTAQYGFTGVTWSKIQDVLRESRLLFVATGAPHIVLEADYFQGLTDKIVLDIAVPRNVSPAVGELPGIQLFNTDDLAEVQEFCQGTREALIAQANRIIAEEYASFQQWMLGLLATPTIARLRAKVEAIRQAEASLGHDATSGELAGLEATVDEISRNLVNKILHTPMVRLKAGSHSPQAIRQQAAVLSHLFELDDETSPIPPARRQHLGYSTSGWTGTLL